MAEINTTPGIEVRYDRNDRRWTRIDLEVALALIAADGYDATAIHRTLCLGAATLTEEHFGDSNRINLGRREGDRWPRYAITAYDRRWWFHAIAQ
jgi:hypothetical protein